MSLNEYAKYKKELKNVQTHKFMHIPEEHKKEIYSIHQREKHKTVWYRGGDWVEMTSSNSRTNPEVVSYRCPTFPYHSLHRSVMITKTPKIKAMEGFKVRFCDNLLINMVKHYRLYHNEIELQYGNTLSLMIALKNNSDWEKCLQAHAGNLEALTTPTNNLQSTMISIPLPYYYSKSTSDAFPLIYCGQKDDLIHQIEYNLDFSSLLQITTEGGEPVEYNPDLLEIEANMEIMPIPEIEANVSYLEELDASLIQKFNSDSIGEDKEFYTDSLHYYEDRNPVKLANKVVINFRADHRYPVQKIYWGAKNNTLSSLTQDLHIHGQKENIAFSPIKFTEKLTTQTTSLLLNKGSYKTEFAYQAGDGILGLSQWSNNVNPKEDHKKFVPGINLAGGSLIVKLNDNFSDEEFTVFVVLNYTKRFRFTSYPKTYQERKDLRSTVVPDDEE